MIPSCRLCSIYWQLNRSEKFGVLYRRFSSEHQNLPSRGEEKRPTINDEKQPSPTSSEKNQSIASSNKESRLTTNTNNFYTKEKHVVGSTVLQIFASKKNQFLELHRINPMNISAERFREWKARIDREKGIVEQRFINERHSTLGADIAAANFIVYRGGRVKFHNSDRWIQKDEDSEVCNELPRHFIRNLYLHSIDASNTDIRYEGLVNFVDLYKLKWLSFKNCEHVDDWFLDRVSCEFRDTIEYLDVSDCKGVTENGLSCLYRFKNLKTLRITNVANSRSFEYMCLLLEDSIPNLTIEGVQYLDVKSVDI